MLAIKTILYPTDFSPASENAFNLAVSLARDHGAKLVLLHVASPAVIAFGEGVVPPDPVEHTRALRRLLDELQPHDPQVPVERELVEGNDVTEILRAAEEHNAELIVMGTHGRTGLTRLLLGSVAEQVLRRAPCMVLTAKAAVHSHTTAGAASV